MNTMSSWPHSWISLFDVIPGTRNSRMRRYACIVELSSLLVPPAGPAPCTFCCIRVSIPPSPHTWYVGKHSSDGRYKTETFHALLFEPSYVLAVNPLRQCGVLPLKCLITSFSFWRMVNLLKYSARTTFTEYPRRVRALHTYSMVQNPTWESDSRYFAQILHLLWNPLVHYPVQKSLPLDPALRQMSEVLTLISYLFMIHFSIILSSSPGRPRWSSGSVLATGPEVRGFKPSRGRWIFKGDIKSVARLPSEGSKAVGPMS
jgi:hypothetical protein